MRKYFRIRFITKHPTAKIFAMFSSPNLLPIMKQLLTTSIFLLALAAISHRANSQSLIVQTGGSCVGAAVYLLPVGSVCATTWTITAPAGSYTLGTENTNSITITWNTAVTGAIVKASYSIQPSCTSQTPMTVTVNIGSPPATAPSTPVGTLTQCQGTATSQFTATGGNSWSIANAGTSTISSSGTVTWDPNFSGTAVVSVRASNSCGTSAAASTSVTVTPTTSQTLSISIQQSGPSFCAGHTNGTSGFSIVGAAINGSYVWYKNNIVVPASDNDTHAPAFAYIPQSPISNGDLIKCVLTSNGNCTTSAPATSNIITVSVPQPSQPFISISIPIAMPGQMCAGDNLTFTAAPGSSGYTLSNYQWTINGNVVPNNTTNVFSTTSYAQNNIVTATATAAGNCISTTVPLPASTQGFQLTVYPKPVPSINPSGSLEICSTCTQTISALPTGTIYTYQWIKDGGQLSSLNTSSISAGNSGVYSVIVSGNGCSGTSGSTLNLLKNIAPVPNAGPDQTFTLPVNSITLNGSASDLDGSISSVQWTQLSGPATILTGATTLNLSLTAPVGGNYNFQLAATDNFNETVYDNVAVTLNYPPNYYNYVRETTVLKKAQKDLSSVASLTIGDKNVSTNYFDGLERSMQIVATQGSPAKNDIVIPVGYDQYGRKNKTYLPYVSAETNGYYKQDALKNPNVTFPNDLDAYRSGKHYNYYQIGGLIANDQFPYSETRFESSPLERPAEQGAPGATWQPDATDTYTSTDRTVKFSSETNIASDSVLKWTYAYPTATYPSGLVNASVGATPTFYDLNSLSKIRTKDEHYNEIIEFRDKDGRVLLKKVQAAAVVWAYTYYIYDDFSNLVCVLQPAGSKSLFKKPSSDYFNQTDAVKDVFLSRWSFRYSYDLRRRMVTKQVPGAQVVYMVYDGRDRLMMTQDGNQRPLKQWVFTKYDALNRPVLTGMLKTNVVVDQPGMQLRVNTFYGGSSPTWYETYQGSGVHGYTNNSYPQTDTLNNYLTITYYDNYNFKSLFTNTTSFNYLNTELDGTLGYVAQDNTYNPNVIGRVTGSKVRMISTASWLKSIHYYDSKYRLIQQIADNTKGHDITTTTYDFVGRPLRTKTSLYTGQPVTWTNVVGATASVNNVSYTGSGTDWSQGATSTQTLPASTDGWVEVTVAQVSTGFMVGLGDVYGGVGYGNIDYAWYVGTGQLNVRENGNQILAAGSVVPGDVLRVERVNGKIYYKRNGVIIYPSAVASTTSLFTYITLRNTGAKIANVVVSNTFSIPSSLLVAASSFAKRFTYDQVGRLTDTWHKLNSGTEILLTHNAYNEVGQLIDKKLHSTVTGATDAKQSVDYRYNIRGWLTSINNAELSNTGTNDDTGDLFGMNLAYNNDLGTGNASNLQYNGNINAIKWSSGLGLGAVKEMAYNFTYDPMNRLLGATHKQANTLNTWVSGQYHESGLGYDLNGNIKALQRNGTAGTLIDNLVYNYGTTGNQLQYVTDNAAATDKAKGFNDGNISGNDYVYDANGNMTIDKNKTITTAITYNYLNLPEKVIKGTTNDYILYFYDATGAKQGQVLNQNSVQKFTDYIGPWIFENNVLQFIQHDEGRIVIASEQKLNTNSFNVATSDMVATANVGLSTTAINGENYIKVACTANGGAVKQGVTFNNIYTVTEGERYLFRVRGYFNGNYVSLYAKGNSADLVWPGVEISKGPINETWVENTIVIPQGITQLSLGVLWTVSSVTTDNFLLNEMEFYKLNTNATPEYQYNLKDHLGNVRVTFTSKNDVQSNTATMEAANRSSESGVFVNYNKVRIVNSSPLFDHTNNPGGNGSSIRLSGSTNEKTGLVKTLAVMPNDVVHMEVYAKYLDTNPVNWDAALTTLVSNISAGSSTVVTDGSSYSTNGSNPFPYTGLNGTGSSTATGPKAYLNYIMFDKDFNPILPATDPSQTNYKRMSNAALENGKANLPDGVAHELLQADVTVKQPGYMYIYLSNEETSPVEVYFDDFKVTQVKSPVVSADDYYPFGLTYNSYSRENSVKNKFKFQGQEHVDDLGLNWDSFKWRNHQPDIGRFFNIDPLAEKYYYNSPYAFSENKVVSHRELEGLEAESIQHLVDNVSSLFSDNKNEQRQGANNLIRSIPGLKSMEYIDKAINGSEQPSAQETFAAAVDYINFAAIVVGSEGAANTNRGAAISETEATQTPVSGGKTFETYTKPGPKGEVYSGRTSGKGTPQQNVSNRDVNHHMNSKGFGKAVLDKSSPNKAAIRGREQQLIEKNGGAKSQGGTSGNQINGISPNNPKKQQYINQANKEF